MKSTEIQLFDWVKIPDKNAPYRRIWAIEYPFDNSVYVDDYGKEDSDDNYSTTEIEPIPLTAEILEKNGWLFMEGQDYSTFPIPSKWTYQFVPFALRVDGEHYTIANTFTITYVHQLQHALRLCGLDELADNFKV